VRRGKYIHCSERFKYQEFIGYDYAEVKIRDDFGNVLDGKKLLPEGCMYEYCGYTGVVRNSLRRR